MATDIALINPSNPIKNGTVVTTCSFAGNYNTVNIYANNKPQIQDIESKYDAWFDDLTYYILGY